MTFTFDSRVILQGKIRSHSLLGVKSLSLLILKFHRGKLHFYPTVKHYCDSSTAGCLLKRVTDHLCTETETFLRQTSFTKNDQIFTKHFDFEFQQRVNCKQHGILRGQENQTSKHVISDYAKRKKMCGLLDISSYKQNWRDVAGKLRFSWEEIKGIEDKAHRCPTFSPMEDVLTTWEQRDPESSLERLIRVLRDIERFDVISDLGFPVGSEIL